MILDVPTACAKDGAPGESARRFGLLIEIRLRSLGNDQCEVRSKKLTAQQKCDRSE